MQHVYLSNWLSAEKYFAVTEAADSYLLKEFIELQKNSLLKKKKKQRVQNLILLRKKALYGPNHHRLPPSHQPPAGGAAGKASGNRVSVPVGLQLPRVCVFQEGEWEFNWMGATNKVLDAAEASPAWRTEEGTPHGEANVEWKIQY